MIVPLVTTTSVDCNLASAKEAHDCIFISDHAKFFYKRVASETCDTGLSMSRLHSNSM